MQSDSIQVRRDPIDRMIIICHCHSLASANQRQPVSAHSTPLNLALGFRRPAEPIQKQCSQAPHWDTYGALPFIDLSAEPGGAPSSAYRARSC